MPRKLATPTKFDRAALAERVKVLFFAGNTLADACEMAGAPYEAIKKQSQREQWTEQRQEAEGLALRKSRLVPSVSRVAFDRAKTGRQTRNLLAKTAFRGARALYQETKANPLLPVEQASAFKQFTEAAAKIDGTWESTEGNKFAVSLSLNSIVQGGGIKVVPPGVEVVEG